MLFDPTIAYLVIYSRIDIQARGYKNVSTEIVSAVLFEVARLKAT